MRVPSFAVVGRVNEGKSSIVAALTENERIAIGPEAGTTRVTTKYPIAVDREILLEIYDTPGFQEPEAAYAWMSQWLEARGGHEIDKPAAVAAFLKEFEGTASFEDERRLFAPILAGASVVYVVDASHPFRAGYELEMRMLRWTGRPCIALINMSDATSDYSAAWRTALKQSFDKVQGFDACRNVFENRINLLMTFAQLVDEDRKALDEAVTKLLARDERRLQASAARIARFLTEAIGFVIVEDEGGTPNALRQRELEEAFADAIRKLERREREDIESIYAYERLTRNEDKLAPPAFEKDVFAEETWQFFGLSSSQLALVGAASGALIGGAVDAATLGHSFLLGTLLGAGVGGASGVALAFKKPEARFFGVSLAGAATVIGPHRDPQFPWVLLDRALLHQRAVARRPHSVRAPLDVPKKAGLVAKLDTITGAKLKRCFDKIRKGATSKLEAELAETVAAILRTLKAED